MAAMETQERKAFQRQPARAILLDLHSPMDSYTCLNIQDALSSTLRVIDHLHGIPRLTHMSLCVLGDYPECIFPLQPIKGNMQRVYIAMESIAREVRVRVTCGGCIVEGVHEALEQFHRVTQNSKQNPGAPSQIEITLVTCRDEPIVRRILVEAAEQLDLKHLRKITAVCVTDPDRVMRDEAALLSSSSKEGGSLSQMTTSQSDIGMSMLDVISTSNDVISLRNVLKQWLLDCSTDSEHLHLCLPACLGDTNVILKCDLQDRLINPSSIPIVGHHFVLNAGSAGARAPNTKQAVTPSLPLYKLRAEALIAADGVCESVLFGMPNMLRPTACWKLDWEELETNQQNFSALCQKLQHKGQVLLTVAETKDMNIYPRFLVMPSPPPLFSLMVKPIAVEELMMVSEIPSSEEQPTQQALQAVQQCLDMLETTESYNPLTVQSNLHQALSTSYSKKGPLSKGAGVFQTTRKDKSGLSIRGHSSRSLGPRKHYNSGV